MHSLKFVTINIPQIDEYLVISEEIKEVVYTWAEKRGFMVS